MMNVIIYDRYSMDGICAALIVAHQLKNNPEDVTTFAPTDDYYGVNKHLLVSYINDHEMHGAGDINIYIIGVQIPRTIADEFGKYITYIDNDHLHVRDLDEFRDSIKKLCINYGVTVCTMFDGVIRKPMSLSQIAWDEFMKDIATPPIVHMCAGYLSRVNIYDVPDEENRTIAAFQLFCKAFGPSIFSEKLSGVAYWHIDRKNEPKSNAAVYHLLNIMGLIDVAIGNASTNQEQKVNEWLTKAIDIGSGISKQLAAFGPSEG